MSYLTEVPQSLRCPNDPTHLQFIENRMTTRITVNAQGRPINEATKIEYSCATCGATARQTETLFG